MIASGRVANQPGPRTGCTARVAGLAWRQSATAPQRVRTASSSPATPTGGTPSTANSSSAASCRWPAAWRRASASRRALRRHPPGRVHRPHQGDRRLRRRPRARVLLVRGSHHRGGDQASLPRSHLGGARRTRPAGSGDRRGPRRRCARGRASAQADRRGDRRAARRRARAGGRGAPRRSPTGPTRSTPPCEAPATTPARSASGSV
jgi:hypothetical protein